jgi:hypothetical protein
MLSEKDSTSIEVKIEELCASGRFKEALKILEEKEDCLETYKLLRECLSKASKADDYLQQAICAERDGDFSSATRFYSEVLILYPNHIGVKLHLCIVLIRQQYWREALHCIQDIDLDIARYLMGFIHYKLGNLKKANSLWNGINLSGIDKDKESLKKLLKQEKNKQKKLILDKLNSKEFREAKVLSENYIEYLDDDPLIIDNLRNYIIPQLEEGIWEDKNPEVNVDYARERWIKSPSIATLHNYAVSSYYFAQNMKVSPGNLNRLIETFASMFTTLANLSLDPSLANLPWLGHRLPSDTNFKFIISYIKGELERLIEQYKERYSKEYSKLKDYYLLEEISLEAIIETSQGIKLGNFYITPTLFRLYRDKLSLSIQSHPKAPWSYLYTNFGLGVALCLKGNVERVIEIKSSLYDAKPLGKEESLAEEFISYHEGSFYLMNKTWKKAKPVLGKVQLASHPEWRDNIDQLMEAQSQDIASSEEKEEFSQFWLSLGKTERAINYHVCCELEKLHDRFEKGRITPKQMLETLKKLLATYPDNAKLISLTKELEISLKLDEFIELISRGQVDSAIRLVESSKNRELRFRAAQKLIDIACREIKNRNYNPKFIIAMATIAYRIAPYEQEFQDFYTMVGVK